MFRLAGTTVLLGVVLASLAVVATAATVPPDEAALQAAQAQTTVALEPLEAAVISWAQGQQAGTTSLPDAHERAAQPTVLVMTDANDRAAQPVVVAADTGSEISWTRILLGGLVGAVVVVGLVVLTIFLVGTHRHPPLAHH